MTEIILDDAPSLSHAITRGLVAPVDGAAIVCLPELPDDVRSVLSRQLFSSGKPVAIARHETPVGSIALIALPRSTSEVYTDRRELRRLIELGLEEAARVGARVVSLTGLIPSATGLGADVQPDPARRLPEITTGHATTVSAVVLMLAGGLEKAQLDLTQETLACVGVGSIGAAALWLALRVLPRPAKVVLSDLFFAKPRLEAFARSVADEFGVEVEVAIAPAHGVPEQVYDARVIVGATNVANVLDVRRLRAGTVLIDDSAPHCFDITIARARTQAQGDILVSEGGLVRSPTPLRHRIFLPQRARAVVQQLVNKTLRHQIFAPDQIMGCVLSSALSAAREPLPRTVGPVDPAHALIHYRALRALKFGAPAPQCEVDPYAAAT